MTQQSTLESDFNLPRRDRTLSSRIGTSGCRSGNCNFGSAHCMSPVAEHPA